VNESLEYTVNRWPKLRHLGELLPLRGAEDLLKAVSLKKVTDTRNRQQV